MHAPFPLNGTTRTGCRLKRAHEQATRTLPVDGRRWRDTSLDVHLLPYKTLAGRATTGPTSVNGKIPRTAHRRAAPAGSHWRGIRRARRKRCRTTWDATTTAPRYGNMVGPRLRCDIRASTPAIIAPPLLLSATCLLQNKLHWARAGLLLHRGAGSWRPSRLLPDAHETWRIIELWRRGGLSSASTWRRTEGREDFTLRGTWEAVASSQCSLSQQWPHCLMGSMPASSMPACGSTLLSLPHRP